MTEVRMPKLGESVVEGKIARWLKQPGDTVREFEPLLEVETDKVTTEVTATVGGTLVRIVQAEGAVVAVDGVIAVIGAAGAAVAAPVAPAVHAAPAPAAPVAAGFAATPLAARASGGAWVSPVVGRMAAEHGVDLTRVPGTGEGGRVTKKDLEAWLAAHPRSAAPAPAAASELEPWEQPGTGELFRPSEEQPGTAVAVAPTSAPTPVPAGTPNGRKIALSAMRRNIAEHMVRSVRTSPHVTTVFEVDMGAVLADRAARKAALAREGVSLTVTPYLVAALARALRKHPLVNSTWRDDAVWLLDAVNVGVAVSLGEEGLIVPVIANADRLSLSGLARAVNDLAARARRKALKPDETQGGTFTLTNHGVTGSLFAMPIINQPQCAILAAGKIEKRVVVVEGAGGDAIAIRPMAYLGLTFDHRILDGATADAFMADVKAALERWAE